MPNKKTFLIIFIGFFFCQNFMLRGQCIDDGKPEISGYWAIA